MEYFAGVRLKHAGRKMYDGLNFVENISWLSALSCVHPVLQFKFRFNTFTPAHSAEKGMSEMSEHVE